MNWPRKVLRNIANAWGAIRGYEGAQSSSKAIFSGMRASSGSADTELIPTLQTLRNRSRQLYRDNATARSACESMVGHIVATGIDIQPNTGSEEIDARLHEAWTAWADNAGADGSSLWELQTQAARTWFLSGEAIFQWVTVNDVRGIRLRLHPIEPDQIASSPVGAIDSGNRFVNGVEVDQYNRPKFYHVLDHHPGEFITMAGLGTMIPGSPILQPEIQTGSTSGLAGKRIPASQIIHFREKLRPGQIRGEPLLSPVMASIFQDGQLIKYELTAAKHGAAVAVAIKKKGGVAEGLGSGDEGPDANGDRQIDFGPGAVAVLQPDEDISVVENKRPSQAIAPFRDGIRGDIAGALRLCMWDLDKRYDRTNYSSSRTARADMQRQLKPVQLLFGRYMAGEIYTSILRELCLVSGVSYPSQYLAQVKLSRYDIVPDGWEYLDPEKEVAGAIAAVRSGMSTWKEQVGRLGKDHRRVLAQLKTELRDPVLAGIFGADKASAQAEPPEDDPEDPDDGEDVGTSAEEDDAKEERRHARNMETAKASSPTFIVQLPQQREAASPVVNVTVEPTVVPAPVVHVEAPQVTVEAARSEAPSIVVNVPEQPAPVVQIQPPVVHVAAPQVTIDNQVSMPARTVKATPQKDGSVLMVPQED